MSTKVKTSQPRVCSNGKEVQKFGSVVRMPIGLTEEVCQESAALLNQILADTVTLRDLYKKHHWQVYGPTFYPLHLLFDKHFEEQSELIDEIAERIQSLGGIAIAMGADVAELTTIPRPPKGREEPLVQLSRLAEAHEIILEAAHSAAARTIAIGDDGSNDLLISDIIRTNEKEAWFIAQHLVPAQINAVE